MLKYIGALLTICVTSFYFFPFQFTFLPYFNTKMILAAIGLIVLGFRLAKFGRAQINKNLFILSLWAILVSLIGFVSVAINNTHDYTYAAYIVSMWVWLGGAYSVVNLMKKVHGEVSARLVCNYLIVVCVAQCVIAFLMGQYPILKNFVDSFLASEGFMGKVEGRLYGIGASLDVAGMRFGAVLIMIAFMVTDKSSRLSKQTMILYLLAFFLITVIGNMIGRTTIVGTIMALIYWTILAFIYKGDILGYNCRLLWKYLVICLCILIPVIVFAYNQNVAIRENLRFAFEGFFSMVEKGYWETNSTNILQKMFVFPYKAKTWIIGDGYFDNPILRDPYYIGKQWLGFYQDTDAGYCRFLFYFGICGLTAFCLYMFNVAKVCINYLKPYKLLFVLILIMNYVVWIKVASDLFLVFALFLCLTEEDDKDCESLSTT